MSNEGTSATTTPVESAAAPPTLSTEAAANRVRPWKATKTGGSTANTQKSKKLGKNWETRMSERLRDEGVKKMERELKQEKAADIEKRRAITKERREALEEKRRLEEAAQRMSAKRLQRMKKRLGRSKKVAQ